jgi:cyclopropane-fatty-acyl-phospholipid synthase
MIGMGLAEAGYLPDWMIRRGIRWMLRDRLRGLEQPDPEAAQRALAAFIDELRQGPVALTPELPNEQHYEVAAEFFEAVLGKRLKYSCSLWPGGVADLDTAEESMLSLTCDRAQIRDGMRVLDLGCGWGASSLWIAENYPGCRVLEIRLPEEILGEDGYVDLAAAGSLALTGLDGYHEVGPSVRLPYARPPVSSDPTT